MGRDREERALLLKCVQDMACIRIRSGAPPAVLAGAGGILVQDSSCASSFRDLRVGLQICAPQAKSELGRAGLRSRGALQLQYPHVKKVV